jgi:diphthamide biosynthesis enzyme Dph1/Dph2-like protein
MVVSPGFFYGLGPAIWTKKETYTIDLYKQQVIDMRKYARKYLSLIAYNISKLKDANNIGIIIVLKSGQFNIKAAIDNGAHIRKILNKSIGREDGEKN